MSEGSKKDDEGVVDDNTTSITNQNIGNSVCDLLENDENIKMRVRKCVFLNLRFALILAVFLSGLGLGIFLGHNYYPMETAMQFLESRYELVPKE